MRKQCVKAIEAPRRQTAREKLTIGLWKGSVIWRPPGNLYEFLVILQSKFMSNNNYCPVTLSYTFNILSPF